MDTINILAYPSNNQLLARLIVTQIVLIGVIKVNGLESQIESLLEQIDSAKIGQTVRTEEEVDELIQLIQEVSKEFSVSLKKPSHPENQSEA